MDNKIKIRYVENLPAQNYKTHRFEMELQQSVEGAVTAEQVNAIAQNLFAICKSNVQTQIQQTQYNQQQ